MSIKNIFFYFFIFLNLWNITLCLGGGGEQPIYDRIEEPFFRMLKRKLGYLRCLGDPPSKVQRKNSPIPPLTQISPDSELEKVCLLCTLVPGVPQTPTNAQSEENIRHLNSNETGFFEATPTEDVPTIYATLAFSSGQADTEKIKNVEEDLYDYTPMSPHVSKKEPFYENGPIYENGSVKNTPLAVSNSLYYSQETWRLIYSRTGSVFFKRGLPFFFKGLNFNLNASPQSSVNISLPLEKDPSLIYEKTFSYIPQNTKSWFHLFKEDIEDGQSLIRVDQGEKELRWYRSLEVSFPSGEENWTFMEISFVPIGSDYKKSLATLPNSQKGQGKGSTENSY